MSPDPLTNPSLTMAAAPAAACRPPVEERTEVTSYPYIATRRKRRSDLAVALPETACVRADATSGSLYWWPQLPVRPVFTVRKVLGCESCEGSEMG